jgi:protease I
MTNAATEGVPQAKAVAFLVANEGVEQVELTAPWDAVRAGGASPVLIAPKADSVRAFNHLDKGEIFAASMSTQDADPDAFDALVLPGGVANPDQLRLDHPAIDFIRTFAASGKPIAAICHGPWTLIEADVVRGRRMTSWPSLRTDLRNAGAEWVDQALVECTNGAGPLITSRRPDDLEVFCNRLVELLSARQTT